MPRGRTIAIVSVVAVLAAGGAATGAYLVLRTQGTPAETARRFTDAWSRGDLAAMRAEVTTPTPELARAYERLRTDLGVRATNVSPRGAREGDGTAQVPFTAVHTLATGARWSYDGTLRLVVRERRWKVEWSPAAVHPDLTATTTLAPTSVWPERAAVTAADGERIDDEDGSVAQLVGTVGKADRKAATRLGPPYRPGDPVGGSGLQATFQQRLAGRPATDIELRGPDGKRLKVAARLPGQPGRPLATTLDLRVQRAAADTVRDVDKPASLVAIRSSTGEILAVANNRGDFNRALDGNYAPGSTFKAVTAVALLRAGLSPGDRVTCPKYVTVGGLRIRNSEHAGYGALSLSDSFAHSCNTTFAPLAASRLGAAKLLAAGEDLGFNQPLRVGLPVREGSLPPPKGDADLAAESFGQGRVIATPLVMASVAAALADGTWRPPTLVASLRQTARPRELPQRVTRGMRAMMSAVVSKGTAKDAGLPSGTRGKTGTAEFGQGEDLDTHAWFMGYRGDVAFAVVVEGGGGGGAVAAPLGATFLRALDTP